MYGDPAFSGLAQQAGLPARCLKPGCPLPVHDHISILNRFAPVAARGGTPVGRVASAAATLWAGLARVPPRAAGLPGTSTETLCKCTAPAHNEFGCCGRLRLGPHGGPRQAVSSLHVIAACFLRFLHFGLAARTASGTTPGTTLGTAPWTTTARVN